MSGSSPAGRAFAAAAAGTGAAGLATLLYANQVELKRFTLRQVRVKVPALTRTLRILHISDIHYVPGQQRKLHWLQSLADAEPDFIINTGDNLSHPKAVPEVLRALRPLLQIPGAFVPGSNDYYAPLWKNPLRYFAGPSTLHPEAEALPTEDLFDAFTASGWTNLTNSHAQTVISGQRIDLSGVDDPHLERDEFPGWPTENATTSASLRIGVAHAPVQRILHAFSDSRADLVFAGHTHGGQICLPGGRALVTNCDLPTAYAKGLHTVRRPDGHQTTVHVSAGIGTSAKAPIRLFCPPEATVLTLAPV